MTMITILWTALALLSILNVILFIVDNISIAKLTVFPMFVIILGLLYHYGVIA